MPSEDQWHRRLHCSYDRPFRSWYVLPLCLSECTYELPAESLIGNSQFQFIKRQSPNGLIVTEAKQEGVPLANHVAQAVGEMYASAKYLTYDSGFLLTLLFTNVEPYSTRKKITRGALTNGHEWIFVILDLGEDGNVGTYVRSPIIKIQVSENYPYRVLSPGPDIVTGILAYWVCCTCFLLRVLVPLRTNVRWNTALMILMRTTGFLTCDGRIYRVRFLVLRKWATYSS